MKVKRVKVISNDVIKALKINDYVLKVTGFKNIFSVLDQFQKKNIYWRSGAEALKLYNLLIDKCNNNKPVYLSLSFGQGALLYQENINPEDDISGILIFSPIS